jgi:hypothetical protein
MLLLYAGIKSVPPEYREAAMIDGASEGQVNRFIVIPYIKPILKISTIFAVTGLGCFTGESGTGIPNLVDETFDKGAHFVLGTDFDIDSGDACNFLRSFLSCANLGMNISSSIEMALKAVGNNTKYTETNGTFPIYYVGDVTQNLSMS